MIAGLPCDDDFLVHPSGTCCKMLPSIWVAIATCLLLQTVAGRIVFPGRIITRSESLSSYEYVIVGGGTSGLVVANRLSENPSTHVFQMADLLNVVH